MILVALRNIQRRGGFVFAGAKFSCEEPEGSRLVARGLARALDPEPVVAPASDPDLDAFSLDAVGAAVADVSAPSPKRRRKR